MQNSYDNYGRNRSDFGVTVTWPSNVCSLDDKFHHAVLSGRLNKIREYIRKGVSIDCFNEDGQTALFCAAYKGISSVVALLLSLGAKPNGRCQPDGYTAVHGACYSGCAQTVKLILQAGGDLRLCDNERRTPVCWCLMQSDNVKAQAVRNVIEGARICVMQTNGIEMLKEMQNSLSPRSNRVFFETVRNMLKMSSRNGHNDMNLNLEELATGIHNTGFGKVYFGSGQRCASVIGIPYISEISEMEDEKDVNSPSWVCGKFTAFNPRYWSARRTPVSTRELYKMGGPHGIPDILITELEVRSKLHHPNLLMLLGVCQTDKCDSVTLVFERVNFGSLYSILHTTDRKISSGFATDIVIQICDALEYVHSMGFIHCAVTSHAIILVNSGQAKLSCFEYALPDDVHSEEFMSWRHPVLTSDAHLGVLRHWMPPEVLLRQQFSVMGDVYSLSSVMWELCTGEVPWQHFSLEALRQLFSQTQEKLSVNKKVTPHYWYHLLDLGLKVKRDKRDLDLAEIRYMMELSKKPQSVQNSEMGSIYGSRRLSMASVASSTIPAQNIDDVDGMDVADYIGTDGRMYRRSTSYSSLPENCPPKYYLNSLSLKTGRRHHDGSGEPEKVSEIVVVKAPTTTKVPAPHGILKYKVTKQTRATSTSEQSNQVITAPSSVPNKIVVEQNHCDEKETQTDFSFSDQLTNKDEEEQTDEGAVVEPPKKPERIGAILKLGQMCGGGLGTKFRNDKNLGIQTEGRGPLKFWYNGPKIQRTVTSPSQGDSPNSASTPLSSSFNSSTTASGPADYVLDSETKMAQQKIKETLSKMIELKSKDFIAEESTRKKFLSLQLPPKKTSAVKPASHCLEGVASDAFGGSTELWNYIPAFPRPAFNSSSDKCQSPPAATTSVIFSAANDKCQSPPAMPFANEGQSPPAASSTLRSPKKDKSQSQVDSSTLKSPAKDKSQTQDASPLKSPAKDKSQTQDASPLKSPAKDKSQTQDASPLKSPAKDKSQPQVDGSTLKSPEKEKDKSQAQCEMATPTEDKVHDGTYNVDDGTNDEW